jgi:hypothetical protein
MPGWDVAERHDRVRERASGLPNLEIEGEEPESAHLGRTAFSSGIRKKPD